MSVILVALRYVQTYTYLRAWCKCILALVQMYFSRFELLTLNVHYMCSHLVVGMH